MLFDAKVGIRTHCMTFLALALNSCLFNLVRREFTSNLIFCLRPTVGMGVWESICVIFCYDEVISISLNKFLSIPYHNVDDLLCSSNSHYIKIRQYYIGYRIAHPCLQYRRLQLHHGRQSARLLRARSLEEFWDRSVSCWSFRSCEDCGHFDMSRTEVKSRGTRVMVIFHKFGDYAWLECRRMTACPCDFDDSPLLSSSPREFWGCRGESPRMERHWIAGLTEVQLHHHKQLEWI